MGTTQEAEDEDATCGRRCIVEGKEWMMAVSEKREMESQQPPNNDASALAMSVSNCRDHGVSEAQLGLGPTCNEETKSMAVISDE